MQGGWKKRSCLQEHGLSHDGDLLSGHGSRDQIRVFDSHLNSS